MPTTEEHPMRDSGYADLLAACQTEIERAWNEARDDSPVHRLAVAHPELADELFDFFVCVVQAEDDLDRPLPELARMNARIRAVLANAQAELRRPKPFLALLREAANESVDAIAASMNVTPDFLVDLTDDGTVLPFKARAELVRRA